MQKRLGEKSHAQSFMSAAQETVQAKSFSFEDNRPQTIVQRKLVASMGSYVIQKKTNSTGLPGNLKSGIENLSGYSMDDVKVHYNSSQPAQLHAHAYAQGTNIHIAPGQEKHLAHEAWHVVQQKQGRVRPTMQMKGKVNINDNFSLEKEADEMGTKALQFAGRKIGDPALTVATIPGNVSQLVTSVTWTTQNFQYNNLMNPAQIDTQVVGKKMVADLDPADMRAGNTSGGIGMAPLFASLGANWLPGAAGWVRGHLLNDHLGGPNTDPNLFPITGHANQDHSHAVEGHIKDWMRANRDVRYEVTASQDSGNVGALRNAAARFHCYAYTTDALPRQVVNKTILSQPLPAGGAAPAHGAAVNVHANNWWQYNNTMAGGGGVGNHGLGGAAGPMGLAARTAWNAAHARWWFGRYYQL
jgi:hypothetical protein